MNWKSFRNRQNDKKLIPRLFVLSYTLMGLSLAFYLYVFMCEVIPSGKILYHPDWAIFEGGSCSSEFDHLVLADKEAAQLMIIAPLFLVMGAGLKLLGTRRL